MRREASDDDEDSPKEATPPESISILSKLKEDDDSVVPCPTKIFDDQVAKDREETNKGLASSSQIDVNQLKIQNYQQKSSHPLDNIISDFNKNIHASTRAL